MILNQIARLSGLLVLLSLHHTSEVNGESQDLSTFANSLVSSNDRPLISKEMAGSLIYKVGEFTGTRTAHSVMKRAVGKLIELEKRGLKQIPQKFLEFFQLVPKEDVDEKKKNPNPTGSSEGSTKLGKGVELSLTMTYVFQILINRWKGWLPRPFQTLWTNFLKFFANIQDDNPDPDSPFKM